MGHSYYPPIGGGTTINGSGGPITIQGASNEIQVTTVGDVVTLSIPQMSSLARRDGGTLSGATRLINNEIEGVSLTNGQVLIGNTGNLPTATTITGTTNRVTVTNGAGTITLSCPQDIDTTSSPVFAGCTVGSSTGAVYMNAGTLNSMSLTNGQIMIGRTGTTPIAATLTGTTNQVNIVNASGAVTLSLPQSIHTGATPTFATLTLTAGINVTGAINFSSPGIGLGTALIRKADGSILELTSSRKDKENIRDFRIEHNAIGIINGLVPRKYNYKTDRPKDATFGFIAEEVEDVCKELVIYKNNEPYSLNYDAFVPVIVEYLKQTNLEILSKCKELETSLRKQKEVDSLYSQSNIIAENPDRTHYVFYALSVVAILLTIVKFFV